MEKYLLIDAGDQQKLERFGPFVLTRPSSCALWKKARGCAEWKSPDAQFSREEKQGWSFSRSLPDRWVVELEGVKFKISLTDFGHVGVFPEHSLRWRAMQRLLKTRQTPSVLNLFAYSGGATLAAAQAGAKVCHLDASAGMVAWARENAQLNGLSGAPIRWIVDDVFKFLNREVKRGVRYDGIVLDPPSFGRGSKQEVFKIERDIHPLLELCAELLTPEPLFLLFTTHTPGMTPIVLHHLLAQKLNKFSGSIESGELLLPASTGLSLPCGSFAQWTAQ
jgi:23S rRNA (cytosine1962-C5)-methyltransferase